MAQDNQYLTFNLDDGSYGIQILKVKEIISMMSITRVPRMPSFIKGVVNLRGAIIPVTDLRLKLELDERDYDDRTSIIIIELLAGETIKPNGIIVDTVQEVLDIPEESIEMPKKFKSSISKEHIKGLYKTKEKTIIVLDIDTIFTLGDKELLASV